MRQVRVVRCEQSEIAEYVERELGLMLGEIDKGETIASIRLELTDYEASITVRFPPPDARPQKPCDMAVRPDAENR